MSTLFFRVNQTLGTDIPHNLEMPTCDPLKYIIDNHFLIAFICMGIHCIHRNANTNLFQAGSKILFPLLKCLLEGPG